MQAELGTKYEVYIVMGNTSIPHTEELPLGTRTAWEWSHQPFWSFWANTGLDSFLYDTVHISCGLTQDGGATEVDVKLFQT
jgi:hypothetical protein